MKSFALRFLKLYLTVLAASLALSLLFGIRPVGYSHEMRRVVQAHYPTYVHTPDAPMTERTAVTGLSQAQILSLDLLESANYDFRRARRAAGEAVEGSQDMVAPTLEFIRKETESQGRISGYLLSAFVWMVVLLVFTGVETLLQRRRKEPPGKAQGTHNRSRR